MIRFGLAQINATVGDIEGNTEKIISRTKEAKIQGCDIVIFPELFVTGYPPEDLLLKKAFVSSNLTAIKKAAAYARGIVAVAGFVDRDKKGIYNAAALMKNGKIEGVYRKHSLPNYGVFDEKRYFKRGEKHFIFSLKGAKIALSICEDIWQDSPVMKKSRGKADYLINISASPYHAEKWKVRQKIFSAAAVRQKAELIYVNLTGGQDELVFDGHSLIINKHGIIEYQMPQFTEALAVVCDTPGVKAKPESRQKYTPLSREEEVYEALKMGTRDYLAKNGFKKALIALSGGVDSALVAAIACDALGPENVEAVFMPTEFSSKSSYEDAKKLAGNFGCGFRVISIQGLFKEYLKLLKPEFTGTKRDITEENLQARIRGNIIMALSNKYGWIVLTTGNKSEMSTGYATLYGDMAGGFAVLKDVPKMVVYSLCVMRNKKAGREIIPENIITKAPTAELKHNQKDQDTLPPYGLLDRIIKDYVEKDMVFSDLKGKYENEMLRKVIRMMDLSEYKRRQAPPGIKITPKAFGRDRRMPITNKYKQI